MVTTHSHEYTAFISSSWMLTKNWHTQSSCFQAISCFISTWHNRQDRLVYLVKFTYFIVSKYCHYFLHSWRELAQKHFIYVKSINFSSNFEKRRHCLPCLLGGNAPDTTNIYIYIYIYIYLFIYWGWPENGHDIWCDGGLGFFNPEDLVACDKKALSYSLPASVCVSVCASVCLYKPTNCPSNPVHPACGTTKGLNRITPVSVSRHTDVDAPPWVPLPPNQVFHPVDVVKAERHGGDEPFQGDLDG